MRDQKQRTVREQVTLADPREPRLESQRRFFTANGNDRANREARALSKAFDVGSAFVGDQLVRADEKGFKQAVADSAAGGIRDIEESNAGYNRAWDMLDAENDLNDVKAELPEILRGADWENLPVPEVQNLIDQYMQENFKGLDGESAYSEVLAPGLLQLEAELMDQRRNIEIQNIKQDQRVKIFENTMQRFDDTGEFDYDYLAEQTNIFFDGAEKRVAYWETLFDAAIDNGAPELIDNVPERFASGDPTGATDPNFQDELRQARSAAARKQASLIAERQQREDAHNEQLRYGAQLSILQAVARGEDAVAETATLAGIPGTSLSDISTANTFARTWRDDLNEEAADLTMIAPAWNQVHEGSTTQQALWDSLMRGDFGGGKQAIDTFNQMATKLQSVQGDEGADNGPDRTFWRGQINKLYAPALGGLLAAVDPLTHRVNLAAHNFYQAQLDQGNAPEDAFHETQQRFDPIISSAKTLNPDELDVARRRPQSDFEAQQLITDTLLKRVAKGEVNYIDTFGGVNPAVVAFRVNQSLESGVLTDEEATNVLTNIYY